MAKTPTEIKSLARSHTESALNCLAGIMNQNDAPPAARVSAAVALLDRGWGKPAQAIVGDSDADPINLKVEMDAERFTRAVASLTARTGTPEAS
jgi:hypothetical protein